VTGWAGPFGRSEGHPHRMRRSRKADVWRVRSAQGSLIAKVLPAAEGDPPDWADHRREVLAYRTGVVRAFEPLLRAPRRHGVARHADSSVVLWLEDVGPPDAGPWDVPRLAAVARRLGTAQAALARRPLPGHAWLNRSALTEFVGTCGDEDALLATAVLDLHLPAAHLPALLARVIEAYHRRLTDGGWSGGGAETERVIRLALVVKFAWVLPDLVRATVDGRPCLGGRPLAEVARPWEAVARLVAGTASALRDAGTDQS
jgi:hypothetical protein